MRTVAYAAAVLSAVTAGALLVFSSFGINGLRALDDDAATAAMRAINREAGRSALMIPLFGGAVASIAVLVWVVVGDHRAGSAGWLAAGGVLGLLAMVITGAYNVPRNDALERGAITWERYVAEWVPANHLRVATSLAAAVVLLVGLARS